MFCHIKYRSLLTTLTFFSSVIANNQLSLPFNAQTTEAFASIAELINTTKSEAPKHLREVFESIYEEKLHIPQDIVTAAVHEAEALVPIYLDDAAAQESLLSPLRFIPAGGDPNTMPATKQFSALDLFYTYSTVVAATNANTPSCIVQRDSAGNFAANTITANILGNVTGNVTGNLTGDVTGLHIGNVTGTAGAAVYARQAVIANSANSVGGATAANIASATATVLAASNAISPNTLILRNSNSDIFAREMNMTTGLNMTSTGAAVWINNKPLLHALGDTANSNVFIGASAGNFTLTTSQNTVIGATALQANRRGSNNIALGYAAGNNLLYGNNNIYCGNPGISKESAIIRLGTTATHTACFIAGVTNATIAKSANTVFIDAAGRLGTITSSKRFKKDITDLDNKDLQLSALRPVAFRYNEQADNQLQYGLIAEEVAMVMPELVIYNDQNQIQSVAYHTLPILLLQQYQKQRAMLADYAQQLQALQEEMAMLKQPRP